MSFLAMVQMNILTNKDIKNLFIRLSCILGVFICLSQGITWLLYGIWTPVVLLLSFIAAMGIVGVCFLYFWKQNQVLEKAIGQIDQYLAGHRDVRIACDREGSLYKLFHAVNTLAAILNAQATNEQKVKEFLKGTISDISHQIKTPLASLNIYNGLLQDHIEDIAAMREFAAMSEQELDRIEMLVQNLLKITKLDAGSIVIERAPENIAGMMHLILQSFVFRAKQEQKTITLLGAKNVALFCDKDWMMEAMSNLVKNALDHTKPGCHITIEWKRLLAVTQITIMDNGSGIHPEDLHHIFKRFYRSRFSKDIQGIGLGLPLAKAIVEAHDGNITVDSVLGKGSKFVMSFLNLTQL